MFIKKNWKSIFWLGLVLIVIAWLLTISSAVQAVLGRFFTVSSPFIVGFVIAFVINLPMSYFEKKLIEKTGKNKGWYRLVTAILAILFLLIFFAFMVLLVLPDLREALTHFGQTLPPTIENYINGINEWIENNPKLIEQVGQIDIDWDSIQNQSVSTIQNVLASVLGDILTYIPILINSLFDIIVSVVFAVYLLFDKEQIIRQLKKLIYGILNVPWGNFVINLGSLTYKTFAGFIYGQSMAGILTGIVLYFLMKIFGFPYALSVSVVTAVTTLIPFYGAIFGGVIGFLLIAVVDFKQAIWFIVMIIVVQQIEGNILYPALLGNSVGIPGIWVMVTVTIGGALFGFTGMFLAVPVFSIIYNLVSQNINKRLGNKELSIDELSENVPYKTANLSTDKWNN